MDDKLPRLGLFKATYLDRNLRNMSKGGREFGTTWAEKVAVLDQLESLYCFFAARDPALDVSPAEICVAVGLEADDSDAQDRFWIIAADGDESLLRIIHATKDSDDYGLAQAFLLAFVDDATDWYVDRVNNPPAE